MKERITKLTSRYQQYSIREKYILKTGAVALGRGCLLRGHDATG